VFGPALVSLVTYAAASLLYGIVIARQLGVPSRSLVGWDPIRQIVRRRRPLASAASD
jgi:hypothetical protein